MTESEVTASPPTEAPAVELPESQPLILAWAEPPTRTREERGKTPPVILELRKHPGEWALVEKKNLPHQPNGKYSRWRKEYGINYVTRRINGYLYIYLRYPTPEDSTEESTGASDE